MKIVQLNTFFTQEYVNGELKLQYLHEQRKINSLY